MIGLEMFQWPVRIAGYAIIESPFAVVDYDLPIAIKHMMWRENSELKLGAVYHADYFLVDNSIKNTLLKSTYILVEAQHKKLFL